MAARPTDSVYSPGQYNDDLSLRPPWSLWVILAYCVRHALFILLGFLPTTGDTLDYLRDGVEPAFLIVNALALSVLIAALRRRKEAGKTVRTIWRQGRWLLMTALAVDVMLSLYFGTSVLAGSFPDRGLLIVIQIAIAIGMLFYLARSRLVADVFHSFPGR
jgi:hypothetical protein